MEKEMSYEPTFLKASWHMLPSLNVLCSSQLPDVGLRPLGLLFHQQYTLFLMDK